jgi:hypothetical protein
VDKTTLVEADIEAGAKLIRALDAANFPLSAALWLYLPEEEDWRLILATPLVREKGPRAAYELVQKVLMELPNLPLSLDQISLVDPNDRTVSLLRLAISTGPGIAGVRFSRNTINGVYIEDAYLYRV